MPLYEFQCRTCGESKLDVCASENRDRLLDTACFCGGTLKRLFNFSKPAEFIPHHSATTGSYVTSPEDFKAQLKRASLAAEERTGVKHNYVPVGGSDVKHTLTDEGMKATHDAKVKAGVLPRTSKLRT